ncbi:hypothetical protein K438DRAFT_1939297 [Mycena galopus ATCC 62051]|nr:hypothetical protein K438DRAFT_1939297 [Mycena galopus ATCC 62051]
MSRWYHPYRPSQRKRLENAYNAEDPRMIDHINTLHQINIIEGKLCRFDHTSGSWVEQLRPQHTVGRVAKDKAASGFKDVWGKYSSPFLCPHVRRSGNPFEPLILCLNGPYENGTADYYEAKDHHCTFKIIVPHLRPTRTLLTQEDHERFAREQENKSNDEDEEDDTGSSSLMPSASQSSSTSVSSTVSSATAWAALVMDPRAGCTPTSLLPTPARPPHPTPIGAGSVLVNRAPTSFYSNAVAEARKVSDVDLLSYIQEISASGLLQSDPSIHPAWESEDAVHLVLRTYDFRIYENLYRRRNDHLLFLNQPIGQVIRELNQVLGVPYSDFAAMVRTTELCVCCLNHFSPEGYNDHRRQEKSTNHPNLLPIKAAEPFGGQFQFRSFRDNKRPAWRGETLKNAIGAAFLEWNSRLGVPADVWSMISTAVVHCEHCDLTHTMAAHKLHLSASGACNDPGQEIGIARGDEDDQ